MSTAPPPPALARHSTELRVGDHASRGWPNSADLTRRREPTGRRPSGPISNRRQHPLPWWGIQLSATVQNIPGPPIVATAVVPSAQIAPSLGRDLAAGAAGT